jgi:subtilisin family serine protease
MTKTMLSASFVALAVTIFLGFGTFAFGKTDAGQGQAGRYIIVLNDSETDVEGVSENLARLHGLAPTHLYINALKGFAATVPAGRLHALRRDPRVAFVSVDAEVQAFAKPTGNVSQPLQAIPTGVRRIGAISTGNQGQGVAVAVIDTGISLKHPDLAANIVAGKNCLVGKKAAEDDNGHGTHVAGTIAALDNQIGVVGVAPQAKLVAVKVLDSNGSGTWSSIICGIDWVTANAAAYNIKVANLSLGGAGSSDGACGSLNNDALHRAICRARDAGLTFVVAAGNSASDAAYSVPAAYDDAVITVSALADADGLPGGSGSATSYGSDDSFATFSNFGQVVDIGAPGVAILSTWKDGGYDTLNGTSMAAPHAAGAAALYLSSHPGAGWTAVRDSLRQSGESLGSGHLDPSGLHPEPVLLRGAW